MRVKSSESESCESECICGGAMCAPQVGMTTAGLFAMLALLTMRCSHTLGYTLQHELHPQQERGVAGSGGGPGKGGGIGLMEALYDRDGPSISSRIYRWQGLPACCLTMIILAKT